MSPPVPAVRTEVSPREWIGVLGALLGAFMAVLDIQITNASLKDVTGALGSTLDEGSWISTSYLTTEIVIIPLSGWISSIFSVRRYLLVTTSLFLVFSMLCGFAWNLESMVVFRAFQGMTGGALIPLSFQIILTVLPPAKRPMGFALFGVTATFAPSIGPTIGGVADGELQLAADLFHQHRARPDPAGNHLVRRRAEADGPEPRARGRLVGHRHDGHRPGGAHRVPGGRRA